MSNVSFKVSSALKTIIGKELITDDFIAVFELVKNSFDANASDVEIIFEDLKLDAPRILIKDNGIGMNEDDILNKWLFLAYSAKKSGDDYRDQIKTNRVIAGSKGIGRFSCDRLGAKLKLFTRKNIKESWNILDVDWNRFEQDSQSEFQTIPAELSSEKYVAYSELEHGTILEISELRSNDWDRAKLLKLRRSLERLINPHQVNDTEPFSITLSVLEEKREDGKTKKEKPGEPWEIVNGPIKNFLFETLDLKTTQIQLEIDKDGDTLITRLNDRGTVVYELLENNPYLGVLKNIKINLFFLNQSAKLAFSKRMGLRPVQYGSVFLYKNGFRVHPFGDYGDDVLGIDRRKQQGQYRFLGSRDLSGRIEIVQHGEKDIDLAFTEISSRDGGLIKNRAWNSLKNLFFEYALKRLENFVIDLAKYGANELGMKGDFPELPDTNTSKQRELAFDLVAKLTQSKDIIDITYDPNILDVLKSQSSESVNTLLKNLEKIAVQQNNPELYKEIARAESQAEFLRKAKEEAEVEASREREQREKAEVEKQKAEIRADTAEETVHKVQEEVKEISSQNLFLSSVMSKDLIHVTELHHAIKQDAVAIERTASLLLGILRNKDKSISPEKLISALDNINNAARKIITASRFATQANFRADSTEIEVDVITYIKQYLLVIYEGKVVTSGDEKNNILIHFFMSEDEQFVIAFVPLQVSIIFDNLISNSGKHKAKNITVSVVEQTENKLVISYKDDGTGISKEYLHRLFEMGFSTTDGSGLGLHHSRRLMQKMNGSIDVNENNLQYTEFILTFNKSEGKQ